MLLCCPQISLISKAEIPCSACLVNFNLSMIVKWEEQYIYEWYTQFSNSRLVRYSCSHIPVWELLLHLRTFFSTFGFFQYKQTHAIYPRAFCVLSVVVLNPVRQYVENHSSFGYDDDDDENIVSVFPRQLVCICGVISFFRLRFRYDFRP